MRKITLLAIALLTFSVLKAQFGFKPSDFTYGKLIGEKDTIVGYFYFDNELSSMGQRILQREEHKNSKYKTYWARNYSSFEADNRYLKTFPIQSVGGTHYIMLEMQVDGKIQLFEFGFKGGPGNLIKTQHYYFLRGEGVSLKLQRKDFKKVMKHLLADNPTLVEKIVKGELGFNDMKLIIQQYNIESTTPGRP